MSSSMGLCMNRPEGFGPSSSLSSPIPTTCFVDTILIPLPVWIYLLLLPTTFFLSRRARHRSFKEKKSARPSLRPRSRFTLGRIITVVIYYLLLVAQILMQTLEVVRLAMISYSVSLLPFVYVALLAALALRATRGLGAIEKPYWVAANTFVWVGLAVMEAVKTVGLGLEMHRGEDRKGSRYPTEDQLTDTAVMAGVFVILAVLEVVLAAWSGKRKEVEEVGESEQAVNIGQ